MYTWKIELIIITICTSYITTKFNDHSMTFTMYYYYYYNALLLLLLDYKYINSMDFNENSSVKVITFIWCDIDIMFTWNTYIEFMDFILILRFINGIMTCFLSTLDISVLQFSARPEPWVRVAVKKWSLSTRPPVDWV